MTKALEPRIDTKSLLPFQDFTDIRESFDRLFNEVMSLKKMSRMKDFDFSPSCEITEEANNIVLKVDVPGVKKENVKVEVDNDQLTISAERKEEKKQESKKRYLSEINYGSYSRTFTLPGPVDEKKIDARFENGVLTVTVPKTESTHTKQIPVH